MQLESILVNPFVFWAVWIIGCFIAFCFPVFLVYWVARHGKPQYRWPFTEVPLGRAMIIKCGSRPIRVITGGSSTYKNFLLVDTNGNPITKDSLDASTGQIINRDSFVNKDNICKSGLYFIGWIPFVNRVHVFHFAWDELAKEESSGPGFEIKARTIDSPDFSPAKTYAFLAKEVEMGGDSNTKDEKEIAERIIISLILSGRVLIVDVRKALIISNWYKQVSAMVSQICTHYCGTHKIDELIADAGTALIAEIMAKNPEILERYGVVFYGLNYNGYEYSGENKKEVAEAANRRFVAKQKGEATLVERQKEAEALLVMTTAEATRTVQMATAESQAIGMRGKANADALKQLREAAGGNPAILQALAIRDTQVTTLALGTNTGVMLDSKG
jgi:hypothetical protein